MEPDSGGPLPMPHHAADGAASGSGGRPVWATDVGLHQRRDLAQHAGAYQPTEPRVRDTAGGREHHPPFVTAGGGDHLRRVGDRPLAPRVGLPLPGPPVELAKAP